MTKNLRTTVAATLIAICQAVALCLPKYSAYFQERRLSLLPSGAISRQTRRRRCKMAFDPLSAALELGNTVINKIFPDPAQRDAAKLELLKMQQAGELDAVKIQMSAIIAEAQSADPWTSRARPSFLYVMYILIISAIPIGILSVFRPDAAIQIAAGMKAWLGAIPVELYTVFGIGYTGYTVARSAWDKKATK